MSVRVYLAAGPDGVRRLQEDGSLRAPAFAVTGAARAAQPGADEEDLEYEASLQAEEASRAAGGTAVVVAADVPSVSSVSEAGAAEAADARVEVGPVSLSSVVSFHVQERGSTDDEELLWYDVTELADVLAYLGGD